jgi:RNA recognition motif-containing protein
MGKKLYVGNLSSDTTESELRTLFGDIGEIETLLISSTYDSGRSGGYGFVEMETYDEALAAIRALNGTVLHGYAIKVFEARPPAGR